MRTIAASLSAFLLPAKNWLVGLQLFADASGLNLGIQDSKTMMDWIQVDT